MQKEFIKNAINDSVTEDITLPLAIEDYDTFKKQKHLDSQNDREAMETEKGDGEKIPMPTRQVLSLRGNDTKSSKLFSYDSSKSTDAKDETEDEKEHEIIQTATLRTVAALFYKLITTFKHS